MPTAKIKPTEAQPPGHGATRDLPTPKTTKEWAEARGERSDAISQDVQASRDNAASKD